MTPVSFDTPAEPQRLWYKMGQRGRIGGIPAVIRAVGCQWENRHYVLENKGNDKKSYGLCQGGADIPGAWAKIPCRPKMGKGEIPK